ncbi:MAG: hypothetical protein F4Z75_05995 [Synechococcus sp. SB0668_bin_15]|nr:hypothetical protein [Synechococcus sp. SB0668_bin_15]MXZ82740.1 hypothetical protein [Synechococcus sp. SB0666_bin_14]MYC49741.1 hypothetical protein [Synechococcus sp. SB0662_bin_14]MYG47094.1 hypothetical protein [Synechococcus sp. SB0675_bin_6]MYJ59004.1 hypothetical protein [Synechococcus sp. SB0672_bin_6]MYK91956.1 hypothetical protein [Synechococcus sp. SB0669_bin_8]
MSSPANDQSSDPSPADKAQEGHAATDGATRDPLREHFQTLLPLLQQEWPEIAREHWEATRGSLEELVQLVASRTSHTRTIVRAQLLELVNHVGRLREAPREWDEMLHPLEERLDTLVDELRRDLAPRLKRGIRQQPLLSLSVAVLAGLVTGLLLGGSRRQQ